MKPPAVQGLVYFIGRDDIIRQIMSSLDKAGYLYVDDTEGIEGIGKTTLLAKLYGDVDRSSSLHPIWINMADFDPGYNRLLPEPIPIDAVNCNWQKYRRLLIALGEELPAEYFGDFSAQVDAQCKDILKMLLNRLSNIQVETGNIQLTLSQVGQGATIKSGDVAIHISDADVRLAISEMRETITREFAQRSNRLGQQRRIVLFLDDFSAIMDEEMGRWFLSDLIPQINNVLFVLARAESPQELPGARDRIIHLRLSNFSREETTAFLEKRLNRSPLPTGLTECIYQFSGGHPQAVSLAADLAFQYGLDKPNLLLLFDNVSADRNQQTRDLVDRIIRSIQETDVLKALDAGCVVRRFDGDLLRALLEKPKADEEKDGEDDKESARYQNIITRLEEYSFTERHEGYYKFHEFIRREMEQRLEKNSETEYEELHNAAVAYYSKRLIGYEEEHQAATTYERLYRYEKLEWQTLVTEWLYHLAHTHDRIKAHRSFAQVYFDAFWWWGFYLDYPFCDRLLKEGEQTQTNPDDREWLELLREFHTAYPTGYEKQGKSDWLKVEMTLLSLLQLAKLDQDPSKLDVGGCHLRAIIDLFLAHSRRYRRKDDSKADQYYQEAYTLFSQANDRWNISWTLYEQGSLAMERGQNDLALETCRQSLALAKATDLHDNELTANNYRVRADVFWQQNDIDRAFENYARAVFYAYAFHSYPHLPDLYTLAFYREMIERTLTRLQMLWDGGQKTKALQACNGLHEFWVRYWDSWGSPAVTFDCEILLAEKQRENMIAYLFPPEPREPELGDGGKEYVERVNYIVNEMIAQIEAED